MKPSIACLLLTAVCFAVALNSSVLAQDAVPTYDQGTGDVFLDFTNANISLASVVTSQAILDPGMTDFSSALGAPITNTTTSIGWDSGGAGGLPVGVHDIGPILNPGLDLVFEDLGAAGSRSRVFDNGVDVGFLALTFEITGSGTTNFVAFNTIPAVPEPTTLGSIGLCGLGLLSRRRR